MFIAIIIPPARENLKVALAILMAVTASLIFTYVPIINNISSGWAIIIITVVVSAVCATFFPIEITKEGEDV
jgi:asparagine N-glycosylation enzyme membrane subunit Stt3